MPLALPFFRRALVGCLGGRRASGLLGGDQLAQIARGLREERLDRGGRLFDLFAGPCDLMVEVGLRLALRLEIGLHGRGVFPLAAQFVGALLVAPDGEIDIALAERGTARTRRCHLARTGADRWNRRGRTCAGPNRPSRGGRH